MFSQSTLRTRGLSQTLQAVARSAKTSRPPRGLALRQYHGSRALAEEPKRHTPLIGTRVKGATWATFGLFAAAAGAVTYFYTREKETAEQAQQERTRARETTGVGKPKIGGPFSLVDENGVRRTDRDFLGQFMLVYFGFTYCPDICPIELTKMADALNAIEKGPNGKALVDKVQPIFISVDPKRDSLPQIKRYTKEFHPKLLGMTGTKEEIAEAAKAYRVYFSTSQYDEQDPNGDYLVDHSIFIYLMGPDGQLLEYFGQNRTAEEMRALTLSHLTAA